MKNLLLIAFSALLLSCSSDNPSWGDTDINTKSTSIVNIKIKDVEDFTATIRSTPLSESNIQSVFYAVVQNENKILKSRYINPDQFVNGISDTLPNGNYRIMVYASTGKPNADSTFYEDNNSWYIANSDYANLNIEWRRKIDSDMFECHKLITVDGLSQDVELSMERIMSKIEIIPTDLDKSPANFDRIFFFIGSDVDRDLYPYPGHYNYISYSMKNQKAQYLDVAEYLGGDDDRALSSNSYNKEALLSVNTNNPISMYVPSPVNSTGRFLYARIFYINGASIIRLIKSDLIFERNKILRLKGQLFASDYDTNEIKIDNEWKVEKEDVLD